MKTVFLSIFFSLLVVPSFSQSETVFSKQQVLEDLNYLYQSLIDAHYNIYAYTTKEKFDASFEETKKSIQKDSLGLLETINTFQRFVATANNGHTDIGFPGQVYRDYAMTNGTLFPLEIAIEDGTCFIRKNWSKNDTIQVGSEILSINGSPMSEVLSKIYPQIAAERQYFKNVKIELFSFPRYYWQVFGKQDSFRVKISSNNTIKTYNIKAINLINDYETKRTEVLNATMNLKFFKQTALLNPGNFAGDEEKYQKFIDSTFQEIKKEKPKNLIIDLRNNAGGNDSFSDYLVSYIATKPFKWNSSFTLKTSEFLKNHVRKHKDTTDGYWSETLSHKNNEIYTYDFKEYQPQSKQKRFTGSVFVLVNRQSHSQATVTAAQIQDYKFGTIVGEETSDYSSLYASQFDYQLPNTAISVKVSKGFIVRVNGKIEQKGVQPDIVIKDHLLDENDEILNRLLAILQKRK